MEVPVNKTVLAQADADPFHEDTAATTQNWRAQRSSFERINFDQSDTARGMVIQNHCDS